MWPMKTIQKKLKAEFLAEAETLFDQLMAWEEQPCELHMTQIEEIVLQLRQRLGEQMAQAVTSPAGETPPGRLNDMSAVQKGSGTQRAEREPVRMSAGQFAVGTQLLLLSPPTAGFFPPG
jgi:hypothetical protein